ncbi:MAG TPA: leucine-rich repeat domain-containing protein [Verrucomicrobiae bacterium]|nr:leucine-rich repeat domain-containing protein [Verrucomicrobiae bacterium]
MTSVTIPQSIASIGYGTFNWCAGLTNVTIPNSVTNIGDFAFGNSTSLSGGYFQGNAPALGVRSHLALTVPPRITWREQPVGDPRSAGFRQHSGLCPIH